LSKGGSSIEAVAVYLRYCHAIGFERLSALLGDVFGVTISEGALANLFKRVGAQQAADVIGAEWWFDFRRHFPFSPSGGSRV